MTLVAQGDAAGPGLLPGNFGNDYTTTLINRKNSQATADADRIGVYRQAPVTLQQVSAALGDLSWRMPRCDRLFSQQSGPRK